MSESSRVLQEVRPAWRAGLRRDPYEKYLYESDMYTKWWADRMWVMEPAKAVVAKKMESLKEFPPARGSSLSLGQIFDKIQFASPGQ
jgi:hypothetical protein